jgi:hypothetical protein
VRRSRQKRGFVDVGGNWPVGQGASADFWTIDQVILQPSAASLARPSVAIGRAIAFQDQTVRLLCTAAVDRHFARP